MKERPKRIPGHKQIVLFLLLILAIPQVACHTKTVRIGVVLPLSGEYADYGEASRKGVELALEKIATDPAYPLTLALTVVDSESDPAKAEQLLDDQYESGVFAALGGLTSAEAQSMIHAADRHERVLLSPWGSSDELTHQSQHFYRIAPSDFIVGNKIADFASRQLGVGTAVIVIEDRSLAGGGGEGFQAVFDQQRGKVLEVIEFSHGQTTTEELSERIVELSPDGVYLLAYPRLIEEIIPELRRSGFKGRVLTTQAASASMERLGKNAQNLAIAQAARVAADESPGMQEFIAAFEKKYGETPDLFSAQGYDAMQVLAAAIAYSHGLPSKVPDGLRDAIRDFPGVTGSLQFNDHGDVTLYPRVYRVAEDLQLIDYAREMEELQREKDAAKAELERRLAELRKQVASM